MTTNRTPPLWVVHINFDDVVRGAYSCRWLHDQRRLRILSGRKCLARCYVSDVELVGDRDGCFICCALLQDNWTKDVILEGDNNSNHYHQHCNTIASKYFMLEEVHDILCCNPYFQGRKLTSGLACRKGFSRRLPLLLKDGSSFILTSVLCILLIVMVWPFYRNI